MNMTKTRIAVLVSILAVAAALAAQEHPAAPTTPAFDKMKALAGEWKATVPGMGEVHSTYSIQSGGSSLLEQMIEPDGSSMITVYYPQNGGVAMTHYCSAHNQPHMFAKLGDDPKSLHYKTISVDNLNSKNDGHMAGVTFTFKDADHFAADWNYEVNGKSAPHPGFEYTRVK
jgi:hypothetical protein